MDSALAGGLVAGACTAAYGLRYRKTLRRSVHADGWLYFIGNPYQGPVKVGITSGKPEERRDDLQTGSPVELAVLGAFYVGDMRRQERACHYALREFRLEGEWFERVPALRLLDDYERLCAA